MLIARAPSGKGVTMKVTFRSGGSVEDSIRHIKLEGFDFLNHKKNKHRNDANVLCDGAADDDRQLRLSLTKHFLFLHSFRLSLSPSASFSGLTGVACVQTYYPGTLARTL